MHLFEEIQKQVFIDEVAREIREHHSQECAKLNDQELRRTVADGLARAWHYGFRKKYSLSMFVQLLFLAGPDFYRYPPVRYLLTHPAIPPDDRIDKILESMLDGTRTRCGSAPAGPGYERGPDPGSRSATHAG